MMPKSFFFFVFGGGHKFRFLLNSISDCSYSQTK